MRPGRIMLAAVAIAAVAGLIVPAAPGYDAWAWLLWGREIAGGSLSTVDGPAWKPLPVAVTTLLAPAGGAAPDLWLAVARAGAAAAVLLAFVVARRLTAHASSPRASVLAGLLAAGAVALTGGFVTHAAVGDTEPLLVALALGAFERALAGRHRQALALAVLAALVRPETWPFAGLFALWLWREDRALRPALALLAVAVPAAWLVPEWIGSGELLRSSDRARIPNPGQPATEAVPALAALSGGLGILFAPAAVAALAARGLAGRLAVAGAAWMLLVAAMSQAGFSGEPRYMLPGAALLAVAGAAAVPRLLAEGLGAFFTHGVNKATNPRPAVAAAALIVVAVAAAPRIGDVASLGPRLAYQERLASDLDRTIAAAGGRERILACGRPAVGRYRGTLLAWHLDVPKRTVRADGRPDAVTFTSRLTRGAPVSPPGPGATLAATETWRVAARGCPPAQSRGSS